MRAFPPLIAINVSPRFVSAFESVRVRVSLSNPPDAKRLRVFPLRRLQILICRECSRRWRRAQGSLEYIRPHRFVDTLRRPRLKVKLLTKYVIAAVEEKEKVVRRV